MFSVSCLFLLSLFLTGRGFFGKELVGDGMGLGVLLGIGAGADEETAFIGDGDLVGIGEDDEGVFVHLDDAGIEAKLLEGEAIEEDIILKRFKPGGKIDILQLLTIQESGLTEDLQRGGENDGFQIGTLPEGAVGNMGDAFGDPDGNHGLAIERTRQLGYRVFANMIRHSDGNIRAQIFDQDKRFIFQNTVAVIVPGVKKIFFFVSQGEAGAKQTQRKQERQYTPHLDTPPSDQLKNNKIT